MAGLTGDGLDIKRFTEVVDTVTSNEREEIDSNISTNDNEFLGQLNAIFSASIAEAWEQIQAVYDAFNVDKAEGKNLDDLSALVGITRLASTATRGEQRFIARNGSIFPSGFSVRNPNTRDVFTTVNTLNVQASDSITTTFFVNSVENTANYSITVNGTVYSFTSDADATETEILDGLKAAIDADSSAEVSAEIANSFIVVTSIDSSKLNMTASSRISVDRVESSVTVESVVDGFLVAPANSISELVGTATGALSTYNPNALNPGRDQETDEELRQRIGFSRITGGLATIDSITSLVGDIEGVSLVRVFENETQSTDAEGRPPKSYEVLAIGGTDDDVADAVWESKPAGVLTYGNTTVNVLDNAERQQTVNFTRPTPIIIAVNITYTTYDEETFPPLGETAIREAVVDSINALGVDEDVIPTRLFGPIYNSVEGIDALTVEIQTITNSGDTPVVGDWQETRLPIAYNEFATTFGTDVYITGA